MLLFNLNPILQQKHSISFPFLMSGLWSSCLVTGPDRSSPQSTSRPWSWHLRASATQQASHPFIIWKLINSSQIDCFQRETITATSVARTDLHKKVILCGLLL